MANKLRKILGVCLRLHKLTHTLGVKNAIKISLLARATRGLVTLRLPPYHFPFKIRGKTSDDTVVEQVFANKEYPVLPAFQPKTIVDAGANCGASTAYFAGTYPDAEIVALEPEESNFRLLAANLGPVLRARLLQGAIWPSRRSLAIANPKQEKYAVQVTAEVAPTGANTASVRAYSVGEIIDLQGWDRIDLLKLDIEGAERELFTEGYEEWIGKVGVVFIELHEAKAPGCGLAFFRALSPFKYQVGVWGEHLIVSIVSGTKDDLVLHL